MIARPFLCTLALALVVGATVAAASGLKSFHHHRAAFPAKRRREIDMVLGKAYSSTSNIRLASSAVDPASGGASPVDTGYYSPRNYGGDPSGRTDSSSALAKAIAAMTAQGFEKEEQQEEKSGGCSFHDLGGAVLDLSGGIWSVSRTVLFPAGYSNVSEGRGYGTIREKRD